MTLATRLVEFLDSRAAFAAARTAERAARDTFIQAQFPVLNTLLEQQVIAAVGAHSRLAVSSSAQTLAVTGRSFATLPQRIVTVSATVDVTPLTLTFTPTLEFRDTDQFGRIECVADFEATLRRSRAAAVAEILLTQGIQMRGTASAHLLIAIDGVWTELSLSHLEDAFAALTLR
jgi:hypothetical protein